MKNAVTEHRKIVYVMIRKLADADTVSWLSRLCVYSVTRPLHNTTTAVTPLVVPKTPSLQLRVFGACFMTLFVGQNSVYTATCFSVLVRVAATSCGHMSPPHRGAHVPRDVCAKLFAPCTVQLPPRRPAANHHSSPCVSRCRCASRCRCGCGNMCARKI